MSANPEHVKSQEEPAWRIHADDVRWSNGLNMVAVSTLSPRVVGIRITGAANEATFEGFEPALARFLKYSTGDAEMFWDAELLSSHDGPMRDRTLALVSYHRERWSAAHILYRSPLVGVTITAASLLLGSSVRGYRNRGHFRHAIDRALTNHKLPDEQ